MKRYRKLQLPPRGRLTPTSGVDAVAGYFGAGFAWVLRSRLRWVRDALPARGAVRLLEIGYGSGIFFYELARRAEVLFGIDVHPEAAGVQRRLAADGIVTHLTRGSGTSLPYAAESFDVVVIVSALEFMSDPARCLAESRRVLRPGGVALCVTPRALRWADRLYKLLVGFDPESDFRGGRQRLQQALADPALGAERSLRPRHLWPAVAPYELVILRAPAGAGPRASGPGRDGGQLTPSASRPSEPAGG